MLKPLAIMSGLSLALMSGCASAPVVEKTSAPAPAAIVSQTTNPTEAQKVENKAVTEAVIETDKGEIVFKFYPQDAPNTVDNFVKLTQKGFYDGLKFHRVEPGFVVQGGDPNGNGSGGPGYTIKAEFNSRPHLTGTVAMARANDPDSAGSQFYICLGRASFLDGKYTVFGQVTKGMDVVQSLRVGDVMRKVTVR